MTKQDLQEAVDTGITQKNVKSVLNTGHGFHFFFVLRPTFGMKLLLEHLVDEVSFPYSAWLIVDFQLDQS